MSETEGQRNVSPLLSERGVTTISDTVVSSLAGMAAQEVDGVHMGGGASRAAGGVLGSITGSDNRTSGISVEVGRTEAAIDLRMGIEYSKNILETVEEVRRRITDRVESMTGLRIKELNATITDITFPEKEARRRLGPATPPSGPDESSQETQAAAPESRTTPEDETTGPAEENTQADAVQAETTEVESTETAEAQEPQVETTQVETTEAETAEAETTSTPAEDSSVPEGEAPAPVEDPSVAEAATAEEPPSEEGEIAEPRAEEQAEASGSETSQEPETIEESEVTEEVTTLPAPETPEARMRRRAQERARRRRRRAQDS
jgi:uncharacterized alkaline shock family protein YloU